MMIGQHLAYETIIRWAKSANNGQKLEVADFFDFGDSYGVSFLSKDKYANLYWCVSKKNPKMFLYRPNENVQRFVNRKALKIPAAK